MNTHNEYTTPDGTTIRLINDDVLIRIDPLKEQTAGGIIIPDTAGDRGDAGILTTGTILAFGFVKIGGKKGVEAQRVPLPDLAIGQKCVFVRFYAEQDSNKQIQYRVEENVIRMKPLDLLLVLDPEDADRVL